MSHYGYLLPNFGDGADDEDQPSGNTCKRCNATDLEWIHTGVRWRLMGPNGKWHECKQIDAADDFEVVKP